MHRYTLPGVFGFLLLGMAGCNPFPSNDTHPDIPTLEAFLQDTTLLRKVASSDFQSRVFFLRNGSLLIERNTSSTTDQPHSFEIIDPSKGLLWKRLADRDRPLYMDSVGNLYFEGLQYLSPEYTHTHPFPIVVLEDSLARLRNTLVAMDDSARINALEREEEQLLARFGLVPCPYAVLNTSRCDLYELRKDHVLLWQNERVKIALGKPSQELAQFVPPVLRRYQWEGGRLSLPIPLYMHYYELSSKKRFKAMDPDAPQGITLQGLRYLYSPRHGLYRIL